MFQTSCPNPSGSTNGHLPFISAPLFEAETNNNKIYRGSYMNVHVLLNLLNELGKRDKMRGLPSNLSLFATSLINSITQEQER